MSRCRKRVLRRALLLAGVSAVLQPASAAGHHVAAWQAQWVSQYGTQTLEPGQVEDSRFTYRNVGNFIWFRNDSCCPRVSLGTLNPQDRASIFKHSSWIGNNRPTRVEQTQVYSNLLGDFEFKIQAPAFGTPSSTMIYDYPGLKVYREYFGVVADGSGGDWISNPSSPTAFLEYSVIPTQAPAVSNTSVTGVVERGLPITMSARAIDNLSIARMVFSNGAGQATATVNDTARPWTSDATLSGALPTAALPPGSHTARATAFDRAGNSGSATAGFQVIPPAVVESFKADLVYTVKGAVRAYFFKIKPVADNASVSARCLRGCGGFTGALPVASRRIKGGKARVELTRAGGSKIAGNDLIEIDVSQPGHNGRYQVFKLTRFDNGTKFKLKFKETGCLKRSFDASNPGQGEPPRASCEIAE